MTRHARSCWIDRPGGACTCTPRYQAWVYLAGRKLMYRTFPTFEEAVVWRETQKRAPEVQTVRRVLAARRELEAALAAAATLREESASGR